MTVRGRASRPVVMEIIGPAGAGKSAVARWLVEHDRTIGVVPHARASRDLRSFIDAALSLAPAVGQAMLREPRFAREQLRHLVRLETLQGRLAAATRGSASQLLFDEGPLYSLARLRAFWPARLSGGMVDAHLRRSLQLWTPALDLVISLDAPNAVLARRINVREKEHRMRGQGDGAVFSFIDRYRGAYAGLLANDGLARHAATVEIDTSIMSVAEAGGIIHAAIGGLTRSSAVARENVASAHARSPHVAVV